MIYYNLKLDAEEADRLTLAVLRDALALVEDTLGQGLSDEEDVEAFKRVINYFSVPDERI
jgi:hypothetical protein